MFAGLESTMGRVAERLSTNKELVRFVTGSQSVHRNYRSIHFLVLPTSGARVWRLYGAILRKGWENSMDAVIDSTFSILAVLGAVGADLFLC